MLYDNHTYAQEAVKPLYDSLGQPPRPVNPEPRRTILKIQLKPCALIVNLPTFLLPGDPK